MFPPWPSLGQQPLGAAALRMSSRNRAGLVPIRRTAGDTPDYLFACTITQNSRIKHLSSSQALLRSSCHLRKAVLRMSRATQRAPSPSPRAIVADEVSPGKGGVFLAKYPTAAEQAAGTSHRETGWMLHLLRYSGQAWLHF